MDLEEEDKKYIPATKKNMNYALFNFQPTNLKLLTLMRVYLEMNPWKQHGKGCQKAKLSIIKAYKAP